ncbi:berberine bridge enzyme-like 18 [Olea europaea subsp. europaea]|uniref:Berberine bridge enzyme-like 18 n=1 Tax=Olea europaea subsp. europaea TaxID=158383 RepID=A0A8S0T3S0_OLEEU|nr:berberine bridge enzyme-like 18 [Olea europaea subsp. europaea]
MNTPNFSSFVVLISVVVLSCSWRAASDSPGDFLECLSVHSDNNTSISDIVYTSKSNNSSYLSILQSSIRNERFTSPETLKPLFIITPVQESQIQPVVYCAKENDLQIRTRSGGHDYEGLSYKSEIPFAVIDLMNMSKVSINVQKRTAWVEAGATLGELYYRIAEKSRTLGFPAGSCPTVGVGGHFSGGGFGTLFRKYGLAADNVIDAHLVDVNGRLLDRKSMGEDLFWAIRGGGGASFGVITAWKIKLVAVPEKVALFSVNRNLEQNATQLIHRWQHVAPNLPEDIFISVFEPIPKYGLEGIWKLFYKDEADMADMILSPYGGRMKEISESSIPYPHRAGYLFKIQHSVSWNTSGTAESERHINWIRGLYSYMAPYVSKFPRAAYINYRDLDLGVNKNGNTSYARASVWGFKYFNNNFNRLVRVKTMVDPANFFRNEQSIPPLII